MQRFGLGLFNSKSTLQAETVRQRMRQLARLLVELRSLSGTAPPSEHYIKGTSFQLLVDATYSLSSCIGRKFSTDTPG